MHIRRPPSVLDESGRWACRGRRGRRPTPVPLSPGDLTRCRTETLMRLHCARRRRTITARSAAAEEMLMKRRRVSSAAAVKPWEPGGGGWRSFMSESMNREGETMHR